MGLAKNIALLATLAGGTAEAANPVNAARVAHECVIGPEATAQDIANAANEIRKLVTKTGEITPAPVDESNIERTLARANAILSAAKLAFNDDLLSSLNDELKKWENHSFTDLSQGDIFAIMRLANKIEGMKELLLTLSDPTDLSMPIYNPATLENLRAALAGPTLTGIQDSVGIDCSRMFETTQAEEESTHRSAIVAMLAKMRTDLGWVIRDSGRMIHTIEALINREKPVSQKTKIDS